MDPTEFKIKLDQLCDYKYSAEHGGFVIKKLFKTQKPCEWGGLGKGCYIESRKHKALINIKQVAHWRHRCTHCGAYVNPKTGERAMLKPTEQYQLRQFYDCYGIED